MLLNERDSDSMNHNAPMDLDRVFMMAICMLLAGIYLTCGRPFILLIIAATTPGWYSILKQMLMEKDTFWEAVQECKIQIVISILTLVAVCISFSE